jgi:hypothetical protein
MQPRTLRALKPAHWGSTLRISGQVMAANLDPASDSAPVVPDLYLNLALRDPQSGEPLAQIRHDLPGGNLPRAVDCEIDIPDVDATRLMLGEATLSVPQGEQRESFLLATQSFTVTAALDDLLEAIANDFPGDLTSPFVDEEDLDLSLLNLVDGVPASAAPLPEVRPAGDQVLRGANLSACGRRRCTDPQAGGTATLGQPASWL